jgi:hypothetical protein
MITPLNGGARQFRGACLAFVAMVALPAVAAAHGKSQTVGAQYVDAPVLHLIGLTYANEIQSAQAWSLKNRVEIRISGDKRIIRANGIPGHDTGRFPNRGNPNTIREQNYVFRMNVKPEKQNRIEILELGKFGVAVNGAPFDPGAAEFWDRDRSSGWRYEAIGGAINLGLDGNNTPVQSDEAH